MSRKFLIVIIILLLIGANYQFYRLNTKLTNDSKVAKEEKSIQDVYPLLSKRILVENQNDLLVNFVPLRNELRAKVEPWDDTFAFFFEYLPTGVTIGVNEKEEFNPQSLIKVPIVMALYHYKERLGLDFDPELEIQEHQLDDRSGDLWKAGAGIKIKVSRATELALKDSDNTATNMLADFVPLEDYKAVYEGLDIEFPKTNAELRLSVKQYSSIKKSLYLSSILDKDSSQTILKMLTETKFSDKLPAGVPEGVLVAHKVAYFGEELHKDCGIVYEPQRPYLLCMISKTNEADATTRMREVSKIVYDFIHNSK